MAEETGVVAVTGQLLVVGGRAVQVLVVGLCGLHRVIISTKGGPRPPGGGVAPASHLWCVPLGSPPLAEGGGRGLPGWGRAGG